MDPKAMIKRWRPTPVTQINNAELQYRVEKVEKMAVDPQDVCNLFKKLPREIRNEIWRILLKRLATIRPREVMFEEGSGTKLKLRYVWQEETELGFYRFNNDGSLGSLMSGYVFSQRSPVETVTVQYAVDATEIQTREIANGKKYFLFSTGGLSGSQEKAVEWKGMPVLRDGKAKIVERFLVKRPTPIYGLAILRTCKRISSECLPILYAENTFVFDAIPFMEGMLPKWFNLHPSADGDDSDNKIPTALDISRNIDLLFDRKSGPCGFTYVAPMLNFMRTIGRINTSYLTKVKIDDCLPLVDQRWMELLCPERLPSVIAYSRTLRILSTALRRACPELQKLTIQMEGGRDVGGATSKEICEIAASHGKLKSADAIVGDVVMNLPHLKELWLEGYFSFDTIEGKPPVETFKHPWGKADRWIQFVKDRKNHANTPAPQWSDEFLQQYDADCHRK